jgi:hypothetical protein
MNIYHVERTDGGGGYDTFSDFVVIASSEQEARKINPVSSWGYSNNEVTEKEDDGEWVKFSQTKANLIVTASPEYEKNIIICSSFHAG